MKGFSENYWAMRSNQYDKVSWVKDTDFIDAFLGLLKHVNYNTILEVGVGTGAMANYQETENDILVNIKHLIVIGEK